MRHILSRLCLALFVTVGGATVARAQNSIIVQESPLAGFQYHSGKKLWDEMKVGDALTLVREPDNPHDPNAVSVHWKGSRLGYVPRRENSDVARQMDRGAGHSRDGCPSSARSPRWDLSLIHI